MPSMVKANGTRSATTNKQTRDDSLMTEKEASAAIEGGNNSSIGLDAADTSAKIDALFLHERCNTNSKQQLSTNNDADILDNCTEENNQTRSKMQAYRCGENHKELDTEDCKAFITKKQGCNIVILGHCCLVTH